MFDVPKTLTDVIENTAFLSPGFILRKSDSPLWGYHYIKAQRADSPPKKCEALREKHHRPCWEKHSKKSLPPTSLISHIMQQDLSYHQIINNSIAFVKKTLAHAEAGHDWWHTYRVWNTAKHIAAISPSTLRF
jgi:hypothetical protein